MNFVRDLPTQCGLSPVNPSRSFRMWMELGSASTGHTNWSSCSMMHASSSRSSHQPILRVEACRDELTKFLNAKESAKRQDLILPIYYIQCPNLEEECFRDADDLAQIIHQRQRWDWRDLRLHSFRARKVRVEMEALAGAIARRRSMLMHQRLGGAQHNLTLELPGSLGRSSPYRERRSASATMRRAAVGGDCPA